MLTYREKIEICYGILGTLMSGMDYKGLNVEYSKMCKLFNTDGMKLWTDFGTGQPRRRSLKAMNYLWNNYYKRDDIIKRLQEYCDRKTSAEHIYFTLESIIKLKKLLKNEKISYNTKN